MLDPKELAYKRLKEINSENPDALIFLEILYDASQTLEVGIQSPTKRTKKVVPGRLMESTVKGATKIAYEFALENLHLTNQEIADALKEKGVSFRTGEVQAARARRESKASS